MRRPKRSCDNVLKFISRVKFSLLLSPHWITTSCPLSGGGSYPTVSGIRPPVSRGIYPMVSGIRSPVSHGIRDTTPWNQALYPRIRWDTTPCIHGIRDTNPRIPWYPGYDPHIPWYPGYDPSYPGILLPVPVYPGLPAPLVHTRVRAFIGPGQHVRLSCELERLLEGQFLTHHKNAS